MPRSLLPMTCALLVMPACSTPTPDIAVLEAQIAELEATLGTKITALELAAEKIPGLEVQLGQLEAARRDEGLYAWDGAGAMIGRVLAYHRWSPILMVPGVTHPVIAHVISPGEWDPALVPSPSTRDNRLGLEYTQLDCAGIVYSYGGPQYDIGGKLISTDQPAYLLDGLIYDWQEYTGEVEILSDRPSPWEACRNVIPYDESGLRFTYAPVYVGVYAAGVVLGRLP